MTKLIKVEKDVDYTKITDSKLLYDCMLVKLGKIRIYADFRLRLEE